MICGECKGKQDNSAWDFQVTAKVDGFVKREKIHSYGKMTFYESIKVKKIVFYD
jgi:hypothetical protein